MIRLVPMDENDFARYLARAIPRRAERYAARGVWKEERALETSRQLYAQLLPQGASTPHQHFVRIVESATEASVGEAWYRTEEVGGVVQFWIEWITIEPEHRRKGYASAALDLLEQEARRLGATRTGLDVWSDNPGAFELYRKQGYRTIRQSLVKPLDDQ